MADGNTDTNLRLRHDLDKRLCDEFAAAHPKYAAWASLAQEWLQTLGANKTNMRTATRKFLYNYLAKQDLPVVPDEFLRSDFQAPSFFETCLSDLTDRNQVRWSQGAADNFVNYILDKQYSSEDESGRKTPLEGYGNPIPPVPQNQFSVRQKGQAGGATDTTFSFVLDMDPTLERWRALAEAYFNQLKSGASGTHLALGQFLTRYILALDLPREPGLFLRSDYQAPCLYTKVFAHLKARGNAKAHVRAVSAFLDWVLLKHFSTEDDLGKPWVSPGFGNPLPPLPDEVDSRPITFGQESDKKVLPYKYIETLRGIICPKEAKSFTDWTWAQAAGDSVKAGDWYYVKEDLIDRDDPDCVWRKRKSSDYERTHLGMPDEVHEMWSPVRAMALYIKLQLPLRTFQVRMLDSGEADTQRYCGGRWEPNQGPLASGTARFPVRRGVFREMANSATEAVHTGLFINTNKTADKKKETLEKGYELPWQHDEALYWLERLRNWQARYNPIKAPKPWLELNIRQLEKVKSPAMLKEMGNTCFLFRHAAGESSERDGPIPATAIELLWTKLLTELQKVCAEKKELVAGCPIEFVTKARPTDVRALYPLHALRVSLITAYALDGGVPMPILSKCIAGHSRLIMTLYYTKIGISYVTESMQKADKALLDAKQESFMRWMKDAGLHQLQTGGAYVDPQALNAVLAVQANGASFIKDDKGICPKGANGCDDGGVYVNEETGVASYGPVPGYPQKNCVLCRWFFTGPSFLPGLVEYWNYLSYQMGETAERIIDFEHQVMALEDEQCWNAKVDKVFVKGPELDALRKYYQAEIEANNKLANDMNGTLRLITRCRNLLAQSDTGEGIRLVAAGSKSDALVSIQECTRMHQILNTVAGSVVFAENDASKAVLQAGKAYDLMAAANGKQPVLFALDDKELKQAVQEVTRFLQAQVGSIRDAVPFVEGTRSLEELGIDLDLAEILVDSPGGKITFGPPRSQGSTLDVTDPDQLTDIQDE